MTYPFPYLSLPLNQISKKKLKRNHLFKNKSKKNFFLSALIITLQKEVKFIMTKIIKGKNFTINSHKNDENF